MKISIILPAYNEERRIAPTLDSYLSHFGSKYKNDFELLVISNNCSDNTPNIVNEYVEQVYGCARVGPLLINGWQRCRRA